MNVRLLCNKADDNLVNKERETHTTTFFVFSDKEEEDEEHILVLLLGDTKISIQNMCLLLNLFLFIIKPFRPIYNYLHVPLNL